ncbi:MAG: ribulose-phosphate 3-epimerase [Dehalococcoidia bacterium]
MRPVILRIAPSILTADFARLADYVQAAEAGGADLLHLDVMDGQFVPNITYGHGLVESLRKVTRLPFDIHLMVVQPERQIGFYTELAETVNVHIEVSPHIHRTLAEIRKLGANCGVCINPGTSVAAIEESLPDVDQVMVMTIDPGWGGQAMLPGQLAKVRRVRGMLDAIGSQAGIMVDGGVKASNILECGRAGATTVVCGSSVFNNDASPQASLAALRDALKGG